MASLSPLDVGLVLLVLASALVLAARGRRGSRRVRLLSGLALAVAVVQVATGGFRWQLVPLTAVAALLLLLHFRVPTPPAPDAAPPHLLRRLVGWAGRGSALVVAVAAAAIPALFPMFSLPEPGGPFAVGTRTYQFVDEARQETFTDDPNDQREIPVRVWYPTDEPPTKTGTGYLEDPELTVPALAAPLGLPPVIFSHLGDVETHGVEDAALSSASDRFPVLVFSHGYGGKKSQSTFLMEGMASQGYVVFSLDHPFESLPVRLESGVAEPMLQTPEDPVAMMEEWLPVVQELLAGEDSREDHEELLRRIMGAMDLSESLEIWVADASFLLDRIEALTEEDPMFRGRLDLERIGVFGHSFGGAMAAQTCLVDSRCAAGINLDGGQLGTVIDSGVPRPFMFMYSEHSRWLNHVVAERSAGPAYQAAIMGSGHMDYTDLPRITPLLGWASRLTPIPQVGTIGPDRMDEITKAYVLAFFDQYLLDRRSALLEGPSFEFPEVRFESRP